MRRLVGRLAAMIPVDAVWLAVEPMDIRAGTHTALARVVQVFGAARPAETVEKKVQVPAEIIANWKGRETDDDSNIEEAILGFLRRHNLDQASPAGGTGMAVGKGGGQSLPPRADDKVFCFPDIEI